MLVLQLYLIGINNIIAMVNCLYLMLIDNISNSTLSIIEFHFILIFVNVTAIHRRALKSNFINHCNEGQFQVPTLCVTKWPL